ncbi:hypothetical protein LJC11_03090 [Bacteroidales bacterium OttesenSCG-928-I21]|nr:hypothetical protein [Bacteroidales bacterium OttesenSCG-928-I21]
MTEKNGENLKFVWRVTVAHTIAYVIATLFSLQLYSAEWFMNGVFSQIMRPATDPIGALAPCFQIIRGVIMALVLLPIRKVFIEEKYGFWKFGFLIFGLSVLSTFAATQSSIDGFVYTKLSLMEHLIGYPVAFLWIFLFSCILWLFYKYEKKTINIIAIVLVTLIIVISFVGYITALQI